MIGMNAKNGKWLDGIEHISQSVTDILMTPVGTRVMLKEYGSDLPELVDQPDNSITLVRLYAATVAALLKWEQRIQVTRVVLNTDSTEAQGSRTLDIYGKTAYGDIVIKTPIWSAA